MRKRFLLWICLLLIFITCVGCSSTSRIVGLWYDDWDELTYEFRKDGRLNIASFGDSPSDADQLEYFIYDGHLYIDYYADGSSIEKCDFVLSGDSLRIIFSGGETVIFLDRIK